MPQSDNHARIWQDALEHRCKRRLSIEEATALSAQPIRMRKLEIGEAFVREGDQFGLCAYINSGVLAQTKATCSGAVQIVGLRLQREFVGLEGLLLNTANHDVLALRPTWLLEIDVVRLRAVARDMPNLGATLVTDAVIMGGIAEDWIVNVGRRDAHCRIAHLLCELALRIDGVTLAPGATYLLPLSQAQLGDAVGLGRVAVNRVLRDFVKAGVVELDHQHITLLKPEYLEELGDFSALYLHLGRSEQDRRKAARENPEKRS